MKPTTVRFNKRAAMGRRFLVLCTILLVGGSLELHQTQLLGATDPARPNIVFILSDDLGYGDLGCFGQQKIQTPHLDRMAAEGMRLTSFYAGSTVCAPSRCVLMTGQHTGRTLIRGNGPLALRPEDVTVAEVLKRQGYATGLFGKWGLGLEGSPGVPTRQGFDTFFGYLNQGHAHNYYPEFLVRDETRIALRNRLDPEWQAEHARTDGRGYSTTRIDYSHDLIMDEALQWIRDVDTQGDHPFFLYLAVTIPHANNEGTRWMGNGQEVPDYGSYANTDWPDPDKGQAAMITWLDRDVGRLLATLKDRGLDESTLVMFSSDNGHHREGGNRPEFFDANGPLRGMKRDLYEGGIRVPTVARWPGMIPPGSISDHPAYFGDLMATVCDLLNVSPPENTQSVSFLPALMGQPHRQPKHDYLYWEFYERGGKQAVRFGQWKAVRHGLHDGPIELYDLSRDLGESTDLSEQRPEILRLAESFLKRGHQPSDHWKPRGRPQTAQPEPGDGKIRF